MEHHHEKESKHHEKHEFHEKKSRKTSKSHHKTGLKAKVGGMSHSHHKKHAM